MDIKTVLIVGSGTMGLQIALQFAIHGFEVHLYDVSQEALDTAMDNIDALLDRLLASGYVQEDKDIVLKRIAATTDIEQAARDVDFVNESIIEDPDVKGKVFAQLNELCPQRAIFTSNTSQLIPSAFADKTGRPDRFLAFHFGNPVWEQYQVDVMPHPETDPEAVQVTVDLCPKIRQFPIVFQKEFPGFIHNHLMKAYMKAAFEIVVDGVADYKDIDRVWLISEGSMPPFAKLDFMSIDTSYQSAKVAAEQDKDPFAIKFAQYLHDNFISKGKLGVKTGEGFYKYPNPEYEQEGFIEKF
jgi:3-hydroxybutyryl-CoA dehydrogenase